MNEFKLVFGYRLCGKPMVSRAELDFVISRIGHPTWLDLCEDCRVLAQIRSAG